MKTLNQKQIVSLALVALLSGCSFPSNKSQKPAAEKAPVVAVQSVPTPDAADTQKPAAEKAPDVVAQPAPTPDAPDTQNPEYKAPKEADDSLKAEYKFKIISVWKALDKQPEGFQVNEDNLSSKTYVAVLGNDKLTAGRSVLVFGAKGNSVASRSFHFDNEGMNGVTYDGYYGLKVYLPGSTIDTVSGPSKWLVVKADSRLRGENSNGQAHSENNYKLAYRELKSGEAERAAVVALAKSEMSDLYYGTDRKAGLAQFAELQSIKDKTQFREFLGLLSRQYGSAENVKVLKSLPLPSDFIAKKYYSGIVWQNWLQDKGLKTNADPATKEQYLAAFVQNELKIAKLEDEAAVTDERATADLASAEYVEYAFMRTGAANAKGFSTEAASVGYTALNPETNDSVAVSGHPALTAGAAKYVQYEVVKVSYQKVTAAEGKTEVVKNKEYTWILTDGSAYRYAPQLELPN